MDNRNEPLVVTALVAGLVGLAPAQPEAARDPRPTLSVVSFEGAGVTPETGDAMADELAAHLVETGRYRVMPRGWLATGRDAARPTLDALRTAAAAAGVQFLLLGETRSVMRLGVPHSNVLFIDVSVVSVATGDVVRTAAGRVQTARRTSRALPVVPMTRPRAPVSVVGRLAAAAVRSPNQVPAGRRGWEEELAFIARSLKLPEVS